MLGRKKIKEKRRLPIRNYFQDLKQGDHVTLVRNPSFKAGFPKQFHGRTGTIIGKQGRAYIVRLLNGNKYKTFNINPIHLKKINIARRNKKNEHNK